MAKIKETKAQTTIYQILHRGLTIEQDETNWILGAKSGISDGCLNDLFLQKLHVSLLQCFLTNPRWWTQINIGLFSVERGYTILSTFNLINSFWNSYILILLHAQLNLKIFENNDCSHRNKYLCDYHQPAMLHIGKPR